MTPEQTEFLKKSVDDLFEQVQNLRNRATDSLDEGATYCFVLCNAKISFINSLISDVLFALSGQAPDVVVESVLLAVQHVDENFKPFLGTCGEVNQSNSE